MSLKDNPKKLLRILCKSSSNLLRLKATNLVSLYLVLLECCDILRICICQASYHYMHIVSELFATSTGENFFHSISEASSSHCGEFWYIISKSLIMKTSEKLDQFMMKTLKSISHPRAQQYKSWFHRRQRCQYITTPNFALEKGKDSHIDS